MFNVIMFVEDDCHKNFIEVIIQRIASELISCDINIIARNATGGIGSVKQELEMYIKDIKKGRDCIPGLLMVATDCNCKGMEKRKREILSIVDRYTNFAVLALPDPHIERWLLLDSGAFKKVFGRGCSAPDHKCEKDRYKVMLNEQIESTGQTPLLGGVEYAKDIAEHVDLDNVRDDSLKEFIDDLRIYFKSHS